MVLLADADLTAQQVAQEVSGEPNADELHRMIYLFRHGQAQRYSIQSLLGSSPIMRKVRAQVEAAAASLANTLVCGRPGNGRKHVALAIHYQSHGKEDGRLLPIDAKLLTEDLFSRTLERLHSPQTSMKPTLLIENLERMQAQYQSALLSAISHDAVSARIIATFDDSYLHHPIGDKATETVNSSEDQRLDGALRSLATMDAALLNAISTITIRIPPLADRLEDLPILAQYFLEACNRNSSKQVEALQSDTIDLLALYSWPGGLDQLRETIETAHDACASHAIAPSDLPPFFYQAFHAVAHAPSRRSQSISMNF